jgi:hypothetical protein
MRSTLPDPRSGRDLRCCRHTEEWPMAGAKPMVNWDVVAKNLDAVTAFARELLVDESSPLAIAISVEIASVLGTF